MDRAQNLGLVEYANGKIARVHDICVREEHNAFLVVATRQDIEGSRQHVVTILRPHDKPAPIAEQVKSAKRGYLPEEWLKLL